MINKQLALESVCLVILQRNHSIQTDLPRSISSNAGPVGNQETQPQSYRMHGLLVFELWVGSGYLQTLY